MLSFYIFKVNMYKKFYQIQNFNFKLSFMIVILINYQKKKNIYNELLLDLTFS